MPNRGIHLGFIESPCMVNTLATAGIFAGILWPRTRFPHAGHVFVSTWASLFHILMALGSSLTPTRGLLIVVFLFLAVWVPCCTSDIVFPLIFARKLPFKTHDP